MLTKSAIAKSTLITSAALSIAMIAGSTFVVGEPPKSESSITIQLTLGENKPPSETTDDDFSFSLNPNNPTSNKASEKTAKKSTANRSDAWKEKFRQALKEDTEFTFVDTPLVDAIEIIGKQHRINIRLDRLVLEEAGIPTDEPVNLIISGVTLESALKIMFENTPNEELVYILEDEVMKITTSTKADELVEVRFYPIPKGLSESSATMGLGSNEGMSLMDSGPAGTKDPQLIDFVMDMVDEGGSWKRDGGFGTIWIVGNSLAVRQTQQVHREMGKFWSELEAQMEEGKSAALIQPKPKPAPKAEANKTPNAGGGFGGQGGGGGGFF